MDLIKSLIGRARGCPPGSDPLRYARLLSALAPLDKVSSGLARQTATYVATGEPSAVLLTLQNHAQQVAAAVGLTDFWSLKVMQRSALREMFDEDTPWDATEFRRLGQVLEQAAPAAFGQWRYDVVGTERGADWLAALLTLTSRMRREQANRHEKPLFGLFTVPRILEMMAADGGDNDGPLLDVLLHGHGYGIDSCVPLLPGAEDYLRDESQRVIAAAGVLDAPGRVELAATIGRLGLAEPYAELLIDYATGSAKTVRKAARSALQGLAAAPLLEKLSAALNAGNASQRAHAAELIGFVAGEPGRALLQTRLEADNSKKVREAIRSTLARLDVTCNASTEPAASANDNNNGSATSTALIALDGSPIEQPPALELPNEAPLPATAFAPLHRAAESFNAALKQGKADAPKKGYHWTRHIRSIKAKHLAAFEKRINGKLDYSKARPALGPITAMSRRGIQVPFDDSGIDAFYANPAIGLAALVRIISCEIYNPSVPLFSWLGNPWGSRAVPAALQRLQQGGDLRLLATLWHEAGGTDPLRAYLQSEWRDGIDEPPVDGLNVYILDQLELLDEALGLRPQSGDKPLLPDAAVEVLARLPQIPNRYLGALMELATGSRKTLQEPARQLLASAPHINPAIAELLASGQQAIRAGAADWLAARDARDQIPAIRKALKKERSELARAALLTALERLGEDISEYFDPAALRAEADKGLRKTKLTSLDWLPLDQLPALRWRDDSELDPVVLRWWVVLANKLKQPGGNALFDLYLERLAPDDAGRLGLFLLRAWIAHDTRQTSDEDANAYAKAQAPGYLKQTLRWDKTATLEKVFAQLRNARRNEYLGSAAANKGLLALTPHCPGPDMAAAAQGFLKNHGSRVSQDKALLEALAHNPEPAAMQLVLATANRFKAKSVQAFAQQQVESIAERRGWTPGQLADRTIPSAGIDESGRLQLDCGDNRVYSATLNEENQLVLKNPAGKPVKALPAARGEDDADQVKSAKKALSTAKKELKQVLAMQTARLQEAMCLERSWQADEWREYLLHHPIVGRLCQRLLWLAIDADQQVVASFRPLDDLSLTDTDDEEIALATEHTIKLAHRTLLSDDSREAWLTHLADYEIQPLFEQLNRPLMTATDKPPKAAEVDDRRGWMIESFKLRGAASKLGYQRGEAQDGGVFMDYVKRFEAAGIAVVIEFTGSPLPEENIACALLNLSFHPIRRQSYGWGRPMPLSEVPSVLLSEAWNDYLQLAEAGSGFDKGWEKKAEFW